MTRILLRLALGASLTILSLPSEAFAGRGAGMQRGGGGGGGMQRGGGGGMQRGFPSFSQPHYQMNGSSSNHSNAGAAAAGAGAANHNQSGNYPNAGAAAGAGAANRNQSGNYPNVGAAAVGAGAANRNQSGNYPNAGAAAVGVAYANNYGYNSYQSGMGGGYWNGNYGNGFLGSYGGMNMSSPSYGYGSTSYMNPYASMGSGGVGGGQDQPATLPANNAPAGNPSGYDYSQPVNTAAAPPDITQPADPTTTPAAQAHQAFQSGDYSSAILLTQQALGQTPNDVGLHQFLALDLFAQGNYEQAAAPLYAVLAVGPGWDWTTLIGNYNDSSAYTLQLRGLEAFVRANPRTAKAEFVLAYHYISQGHLDAAVKLLKVVVALQPNDRLSGLLLDKLQPPSEASLASAQPLDPGKLPGVWVAQAPPNATITLSISDDSNFTWAFAAPGKPPVTISGTYALANGVLTLSGKDAPGGPLAGQVAAPDDNHMNFKALGAPTSDPGLQFVR